MSEMVSVGETGGETWQVQAFLEGWGGEGEALEAREEVGAVVSIDEEVKGASFDCMRISMMWAVGKRGSKLKE